MKARRESKKWPLIIVGIVKVYQMVIIMIVMTRYKYSMLFVAVRYLIEVSQSKGCPADLNIILILILLILLI